MAIDWERGYNHKFGSKERWVNRMSSSTGK
jgi:hypothetical protein